MKKILFFYCLLTFVGLFFCIDVMAQNVVSQSESKPSLYVEYFSRPSEVPFDVAEGIRNGVIYCISSTNRVTLIDVNAEASLRVEKSRRESGNLIAGGDIDRMAVMSQLGANYILQGNVNSISTAQKKNSKNKNYYTAEISLTLKIVNPKDGTTVGSSTYTLSGGNSLSPEKTQTADAAISDAIREASSCGSTLMDKKFQLFGTILEINSEKGGEAKEVYISLGHQHGVGADSWFQVCVVRTIAGRSSKHVIGRLKVAAIEGNDLTLCKVKKGGKEIKDAFSQGQQIEVQLISHSGGIFSGLLD